jgi:hypothetical protein
MGMVVFRSVVGTICESVSSTRTHNKNKMKHLQDWISPLVGPLEFDFSIEHDPSMLQLLYDSSRRQLDRTEVQVLVGYITTTPTLFDSVQCMTTMEAMYQYNPVLLLHCNNEYVFDVVLGHALQPYALEWMAKYMDAVPDEMVYKYVESAITTCTITQTYRDIRSVIVGLI